MIKITINQFPSYLLAYTNHLYTIQIYSRRFIEFWLLSYNIWTLFSRSSLMYILLLCRHQFHIPFYLILSISSIPTIYLWLAFLFICLYSIFTSVSNFFLNTFLICSLTEFSPHKLNIMTFLPPLLPLPLLLNFSILLSSSSTLVFRTFALFLTLHYLKKCFLIFFWILSITSELNCTYCSNSENICLKTA